MGKKNDLYSTNGVKSGEKIKLTRKSIDWEFWKKSYIWIIDLSKIKCK